MLKMMGFVHQGHIVAEICDVDNEPLVKMVGLDKVRHYFLASCCTPFLIS